MPCQRGGSVYPRCCAGRALERIRSPGDGGKLLCRLAELEPPCIIYSLGSMMDFTFEEDILKNTNVQCRLLLLLPLRDWAEAACCTCPHRHESHESFPQC
jgi:hypothetical protein